MLTLRPVAQLLCSQEIARMRREEELLQKTETLLDSPTSLTKSDLYKLAPNTTARAVELFKQVDIDHTGVLEVEVLPPMSIKE